VSAAMPVASVLSSEDLLDDIEHHFKVLAGPGAGKTFWLARHVQNVAGRSERLRFGSKIACISYTNVAVAELTARLGDAADQTEASTIHSFLYTYVVRPYVHRLKNEDGSALSAHELLDGHDHHQPNYPALQEWLGSVGKANLTAALNKPEVYSFLPRLRWTYNKTDGSWALKSPNFYSVPTYFPTTQLATYKRPYWRKGVIDHDDVLYLAHRVLEQEPELRRFLAARLPYVFIDEFQDTNAAQLAAVKRLAEAGSVIGVVGDGEQSIYGFQGALPEEFRSFTLPGLKHYRIENNRRSGSKIVQILNAVRQDGLTQVALRGDVGDAVCVYVGDGSAAWRQVCAECADGEVPVVLTRRNDELQQFRAPDAHVAGDSWDAFFSVDGFRAAFFEKLAAAIELARLGTHNLAIRQAVNAIKVREGRVADPLRYKGHLTDIERRGIALAVLEALISHYETLQAASLLTAYKITEAALEQAVPGLGLMAVVAGKKFDLFASATPFGDLLRTVRTGETTASVRTIHQAKGAEFTSVFVYVTDAKLLSSALDPLAPNTENERIFYVAASRARDRFVISVPTLSGDIEAGLRGKGIAVKRL
jgi:DNA helicase II / ATP-dependent DNA helicase PcrA